MAEEKEKTLAELKEEAISLGMSKEEVAAFNSKYQLSVLIKTLTAAKSNTPTPPVERVKSLEEKPNPAEDKRVAKVWFGKARVMRDKLMAQRKIRFLIPLEPKEKPGVVEWKKDKNGDLYQVHVSGAIETVQLNGFKWFVPKGVFTDVPEQVAEVLSESLNLTNEAGRELLVDRIDPNTGRPVSEQL